MQRRIPLEREAELLCIKNSKQPLIFQLPLEKGRNVFENNQDTPVYKHPAKIQKFKAKTTEWGTICVYAVIPENIVGTADVIYYIHGGGWVFGSLHSHEKLVRELAARTNSIVVFPEYSLSPEAKYPVAIEQCYEVMCSLPIILSNIDCLSSLDNLTVAGDSAGGNMATVMTIMSKYRNGPKIHKQLLYYPVTNANFNTDSYNRYAVGYGLYKAGMSWFWDQYTTCEKCRNKITVSPLRASLDELNGLPDAMIILGEADVLKDEGEAYATKLRMAGVNVTSICYQGMIHGFVMYNVLDKTQACRAAMDSSTQWIKRRA